MKNFWIELPRPFFVLAPMDDVTDVVFREIVAQTSRPDVFFTEFTNCDGLDSVGYDKVIQRLKFTENQRPIVAQIWGNRPETHFKAAQLIKELGFDGVDINMGCPVKSVIGHGSCSALIKNPKLAREIILATIDGAGNMPVSVKTRIGFDKIQTEEWVGFLLELPLAAITVHGRTVREESKVPAHWDEIERAVEFRDSIQSKSKYKTLIVGNGDVVSREDGLEKAKTGVDGIMIGRGIFTDPWVFTGKEEKPVDTPGVRFKLLKRHVELFDKVWGKEKSFNLMKKFFKMYIRDFEGLSEVRAELMQAQDIGDVLKMIENKVNE